MSQSSRNTPRRSRKTDALNYGEINKHAAVQPNMRSIRDFLEWCDSQKIELATWMPSGRWMFPISEDRERMFARYFEIDEARLERERRALLESCR